jgi:hypothetical protein
LESNKQGEVKVWRNHEKYSEVEWSEVKGREGKGRK